MIAIVLCGLTFAALDAIGPFNAGTFGSSPNDAFRRTEIEFRATNKAREVVVLKVSPDSNAARQGIEENDRLSIGTSLLKFQTARAGDEVQVQKVGEPGKITLTATAAPPSPFDREWAAIRLLTLIIAVVVAVSRPDRAAARALAVFLASIGLLSNWTSYPGALAVAGMILRKVAESYGFPHFVIFAYTFAGSSESFSSRKRYRRIAIALGALYVAATILQQILYFHDLRWQFVEYILAINVLAYFPVGLWCFGSELRHARGEMRQRILWVLATMACSLAGAVSWYLLLSLFKPAGWMDNLALTTILLPIGLAYAILRHHIFNISLAINKALVFAAITTILTPFFGLIEYLIVHMVEVRPTTFKEFFEDPEHPLLAIAYAAVVVLVSTMLGWIHKRVEHVSKRFLFRERTRAIADLRQACRDVLFADGIQALGRHVVLVVDKNLKPRGSSVFVEDSNTFRVIAGSMVNAPHSIDSNDPGILRLRSSNSIVVLGDLGGVIPGTYAVPINCGSQLAGFLSIDFGSLGEILVPDEVEVIQSLAHFTGMALEDIELHANRKEIGELRSRLQLPPYQRVSSKTVSGEAGNCSIK